jgi:hypothetical protein
MDISDYTQRVMQMLPFLFWGIVTGAFLAKSIVFLLFPAHMLHHVAYFESLSPPDSADVSTWSNKEIEKFEEPLLFLRWVGVVYLFATAGTNQMLASQVEAGKWVRYTVYQLSTIYYILASSAAIYLLNVGRSANDDDDATIFLPIEWSRAYTVLTSVFLGAIAIGYFGSCFGCCGELSKLVDFPDLYTSSKELSVVTVSSSVPKSRADMRSAA